MRVLSGGRSSPDGNDLFPTPALWDIKLVAWYSPNISAVLRPIDPEGERLSFEARHHL